MYNLKASLYVTVCLPGFVTKTYGEQKRWPDFVFRSFVKSQQIGFRVRAKLLYFLAGLLFEEIVGYDASVGVSVQLCKHAHLTCGSGQKKAVVKKTAS